MAVTATNIEVHQLKAGLSDQEIDEERLDAGCLADLIALYAFRNEDDELVGVLAQNDAGVSLWSDDAYDLIEDESTAQQLGLSSEYFMRLCWLSLFPEEIEDGLNTDMLLEAEGDDFGGELNISSITDILRDKKQSCLICFSQFADCDFQIGEAAPDPAEFELDYLDDRESVRLYYGD